MPDTEFSNHGISRRDFLYISRPALLGLFFPLPAWLDLNLQHHLGRQGRVIDKSVLVYDSPSFSGSKVRELWGDEVVPISGITIGDTNPPHNRVWYQIADSQFVHSGTIQPVKTNGNLPVEEIPLEGSLAEVTVPYTDARWESGAEQPVAYRFYYETTCWVDRLVRDPNGKVWYRVREDKWEHVLYVPAHHLRLVPASELAPISPLIAPLEKRIEVRVANQIVVAYESDKPVFMARVSTGARFWDGDYSTPPGRHITFHKRPSRHMVAGNLAASGYDLPGVPWVTYFTESGISFHGTFWHNDYGKPRSHGCVNLSAQAAKWIYRWTQPVVPAGEQKVYENYGTIVDVIV